MANSMLTQWMWSYGMGVDSTTAIVRGLEEGLLNPACLVVVTAMTGDEYDDTGELVADKVLPMFRRFGVRYVQLARAGQSDSAGYEVLSDSRATTEMVMEGTYWRLRDEMHAAGTVPQVAPGRRICSYRAKGQPLDWFAADEFEGRPYAHAVGYADDEPERVERDRNYTRNARYPVFPLVEWGWDRARCEAYLLDRFGVLWPRSCCGYCPFQAGSTLGRADMLARWRRQPAAARRALRMELTSIALNHRMVLFGRRSARQIAMAGGLDDLVAQADAEAHARLWAIYDVRRAYPARKRDPKGSGRANWDTSRKAQARRFVHTVATGDAAQMKRNLLGVGGCQDADGAVRLWLDRAGPPYPARERYLVAAPAGVVNKIGDGFHTVWAAANGE